MNGPVKNITLKFSCPVDWGSMELLNGAKYCNHCHKKVYDFTNSKQEEFLNILAENGGNLCGRFKAEQMLSHHLSLPVWKKWVSAILIFTGLNIMAHKSFAQKPGDTIPKITIPETASDAIFGTVEVVPEFPGGFEAFKKFVQSNLKKVDGASGKRLIVSFVVEKDGSLTDIKIARSINKEADEEAVRVIKLSPKWKPGTLNGISYRIAYSIPVAFN